MNIARQLIWYLLLTASITLLPAFSLMAQDDFEDEQEPANNTADCQPASFATRYDALHSDTIAVKQVQIWYSFGQEEYKHGQYKRAIPYYWRVLENDPSGTYKVVYSKLAQCYFELTQADKENQAAYLDSTLLVLYKGIAQYPDYATLHYRAGSIQRSLNRPQCAIPHYEALVATSPKEVNYVKTLASLYFQIGDKRAIEMQQKVIDLDPNDVESQTTLVEMIKFFGGDPIEAMREACEKDPSNIANCLKYGHEALLNGKYNEALGAFRSVLKVDAKHKDAMMSIARSYEGLNNISAAIAAYKDLLRVDPQNISALCAIARDYLLTNNFSAASNYAYQAKRIDPNNGEPYMVMGEVYENAVSYCTGKRSSRDYTYDDKLVFEKARAEYARARRDPNFASIAGSRYDGLAPFVRSKEDKFMHQRDELKDNCYSWIQ